MLHGLHGVSGNLALPALYEISGKLERLVRRRDYIGFKNQIPMLLSQIDSVEEAFRSCAEDGYIPSFEFVKAAPEDLVLAMQTLLEILERNEVDNEKLIFIYRNLEYLGMHRQVGDLRSAVDSFEFIQARYLLEYLVKDVIVALR
ncbi:hypothetical protein [Pseudomonas aeruginosa]|uniref:hypothetical protein n=1 Tax=Pseudomonas aeruginosa TaxID=287 RepID=UPI0034D2400C